MRLIDEEKLIEQFKNRNIQITFDLPVEEVFDTIRNQPTAYDVDAVVKKLEELKSRVPVNRILDNIIKEKPKELGQLMAYSDAIEVVKDGAGMEEDEEYCEWKDAKECFDNTEFKIQCEFNPLVRGTVPNNFAHHKFKFCPFCGRRIKWV